MSADLVIPDLDGGEMLLRCLSSVLNQTVRPDRVIVVDDGSTVPTSSRLHDLVSHVEVVRDEDNAGFATAANRGIATSSGEFVALINNDVILEKDWLEAILESMRGDERIGACQTVLAMPDGRVDGAGVDLSDGTIRQRGYGSSLEDLDSSAVDAVSATATVYRREALDSLGSNQWFREEFGSYYEDVELSLALSARGWKVVVLPALLAVHQGSATGGKIEPGKRTAMMRRNRYFVARLHPDRLKRLPLLAEDFRLFLKTLGRLDLAGAGAIIRGVGRGWTSSLERKR